MSLPEPVHYGQRVWEDEGGERLYVLGHPPLRRALAAANHYARTEQGLVNIYDAHGVTLDGWLDVRHEWYLPTDGDDEFWPECDATTPGAEAITVVSL